MSHLIQKHQLNKRGRGVIIFSPQLIAEFEKKLNPTRTSSDTVESSILQNKLSMSNQKRRLATKQVLKRDNNRTNSQKIGQRITIASTTNPEDVRVERIIDRTEAPELTERQENPDRRVTDDLLRQYYNNQELERRFNEEILPAVGEAFSIPSKLVRTLNNRAYGTDTKPFMELMLGKTENYNAGDFIIDAGSPYAWTKGLKLASKTLKSPVTKYLTTVRFPKTKTDYMRLGPIEFHLPSGRAGMGTFPDDIRITPVEKIFEPNRWNRFRNPKYVTETDKAVLDSHMPEYKMIQEKALDEGNYMIVPQGFPLSTLLDDGRFIFTGDQGSWILSLSKAFKAKLKGSTLKVGFKGGTDQKNIEGLLELHAAETFPLQENGVFFAGDRRYADTYNQGKQAPGFWLFFQNPYDMLNGGKKPFLLENNNIRFIRGVESMPSFTGLFPEQTINTLHNVWNSQYINDPEIMKILTSDPNKINPKQLDLRENLLKNIRKGLIRDRYDRFENLINNRIRSGQMNPIRGTYYDGFIGRDHTLGWSPEKDLMWPFGSNPETYVTIYPQLSKLLIGNNGAFEGSAYSRKKGGKFIKNKV